MVPAILTDCMGLLHAARAGPGAMTKGKIADARIWKQIAQITGNNFDELRARMVWMPAHTSAVETCRTKSNGLVLSTAEWRANQLADVLAKKGACTSDLREGADKTIKAAGEAMLQSAARLGVVTHRANNHPIQCIDGNGLPCTRMARDSAPVPRVAAAARNAAREAREAKLGARTAAPPAPVVLARPLHEPTLQQRRLSRKRKARDAHLEHVRGREVCALNSALASATATAKQPTLSAAERMAHLRARLSCRFSHGSEAA